MEIEKEAWAFAMYRFLRQACHAVNLARRKEMALNPRFAAWLAARYDRIVAQGLAFHEAQPPPERPNGGNGKKPRGRKRRRTGHNLLLRLQNRKEDVLRFLTDPSVPFTNNLAERDLRMMKVRLTLLGSYLFFKGPSIPSWARRRTYVAGFAAFKIGCLCQAAFAKALKGGSSASARVCRFARLRATAATVPARP